MSEEQRSISPTEDPDPSTPLSTPVSAPIPEKNQELSSLEKKAEISDSSSSIDTSSLLAEVAQLQKSERELIQHLYDFSLRAMDLAIQFFLFEEAWQQVKSKSSATALQIQQYNEFFSTKPQVITWCHYQRQLAYYLSIKLSKQEAEVDHRMMKLENYLPNTSFKVRSEPVDKKSKPSTKLKINIAELENLKNDLARLLDGQEIHKGLMSREVVHEPGLMELIKECTNLNTQWGGDKDSKTPGLGNRLITVAAQEKDTEKAADIVAIVDEHLKDNSGSECGLVVKESLFIPRIAFYGVCLCTVYKNLDKQNKTTDTDQTFKELQELVGTDKTRLQKCNWVDESNKEFYLNNSQRYNQLSEVVTKRQKTANKKKHYDVLKQKTDASWQRRTDKKEPYSSVQDFEKVFQKELARLDAETGPLSADDGKLKSDLDNCLLITGGLTKKIFAGCEQPIKELRGAEVARQRLQNEKKHVNGWEVLTADIEVASKKQQLAIYEKQDADVKDTIYKTREFFKKLLQEKKQDKEKDKKQDETVAKLIKAVEDIESMSSTPLPIQRLKKTEKYLKEAKEFLQQTRDKAISRDQDPSSATYAQHVVFALNTANLAEQAYHRQCRSLKKDMQEGSPPDSKLIQIKTNLAILGELETAETEKRRLEDALADKKEAKNRCSGELKTKEKRVADQVSRAYEVLHDKNSRNDDGSPVATMPRIITVDDAKRFYQAWDKDKNGSIFDESAEELYNGRLNAFKVEQRQLEARDKEIKEIEQNLEQEEKKWHTASQKIATEVMPENQRERKELLMPRELKYGHDSTTTMQSTSSLLSLPAIQRPSATTLTSSSTMSIPTSPTSPRIPPPPTPERPLPLSPRVLSPPPDRPFSLDLEPSRKRKNSISVQISHLRDVSSYEEAINLLTNLSHGVSEMNGKRIQSKPPTSFLNFLFRSEGLAKSNVHLVDEAIKKRLLALQEKAKTALDQLEKKLGKEHLEISDLTDKIFKPVLKAIADLLEYCADPEGLLKTAINEGGGGAFFEYTETLMENVGPGVKKIIHDLSGEVSADMHEKPGDLLSRYQKIQGYLLQRSKAAQEYADKLMEDRLINLKLEEQKEKERIARVARERKAIAHEPVKSYIDEANRTLRRLSISYKAPEVVIDVKERGDDSDISEQGTPEKNDNLFPGDGEEDIDFLSTPIKREGKKERKQLPPGSRTPKRLTPYSDSKDSDTKHNQSQRFSGQPSQPMAGEQYRFEDLMAYHNQNETEYTFGKPSLLSPGSRGSISETDQPDSYGSRGRNSLSSAASLEEDAGLYFEDTEPDPVLVGELDYKRLDTEFLGPNEAVLRGQPQASALVSQEDEKDRKPSQGKLLPRVNFLSRALKRERTPAADVAVLYSSDQKISDKKTPDAKTPDAKTPLLQRSESRRISWVAVEHEDEPDARPLLDQDQYHPSWRSWLPLTDSQINFWIMTPARFIWSTGGTVLIAGTSRALGVLGPVLNLPFSIASLTAGLAVGVFAYTTSVISRNSRKLGRSDWSNIMAGLATAHRILNKIVKGEALINADLVFMQKFLKTFMRATDLNNKSGKRLHQWFDGAQGSLADALAPSRELVDTILSEGMLSLNRGRARQLLNIVNGIAQTEQIVHPGTSYFPSWWGRVRPVLVGVVLPLSMLFVPILIVLSGNVGHWTKLFTDYMGGDATAGLQYGTRFVGQFMMWGIAATCVVANVLMVSPGFRASNDNFTDYQSFARLPGNRSDRHNIEFAPDDEQQLVAELKRTGKEKGELVLLQLGAEDLEHPLIKDVLPALEEWFRGTALIPFTKDFRKQRPEVQTKIVLNYTMLGMIGFGIAGPLANNAQLLMAEGIYFGTQILPVLLERSVRYRRWVNQEIVMPVSYQARSFPSVISESNRTQLDRLSLDVEHGYNPLVVPGSRVETPVDRDQSRLSYVNEENLVLRNESKSGLDNSQVRIGLEDSERSVVVPRGSQAKQGKPRADDSDDDESEAVEKKPVPLSPANPEFPRSQSMKDPQKGDKGSFPRSLTSLSQFFEDQEKQQQKEERKNNKGNSEKEVELKNLAKGDGEILISTPPELT